MSFGRDLVGAANCGTSNPLMQMAGQMQGMGAQIADVRSFAGVDKAMTGRPGPMQDMMRGPVQQGPESSPFMQQFQQAGPKGMAGIPHHLQRMMPPPSAAPQSASAIPHPGPSGGELADQFMAMEIQHKQKEEFERAFRQGNANAQAHPPDMWAHEFQHQAQPSQQRMMAQQAQRPGPWATEFDRMQQMSRQMGPMGMPPMMMQRMGMGMGMGMGIYGMPMHMTQHQQAASSSSAVAAPPSATEKEQDKVAEDETAEDQEATFDDIYADAENDTALEEAYGAASEATEWTNDFASQQQQHQQQPQMAGGLDKDMLQKLMNSDNPKWRNSKFLKFIDKISKGQIEFVDNQAIEKPAATTTGEEWADQFGASSSSSSSNWAEEFGQHPASWSEEFAQRAAQQAVGDSYLADSKTQAERWLEEYEKSGEADLEFKDFDWQSALMKAQGELPKPSDPTYEFTKDNPFLEATDPFADGMRLFKEGRLKDAILAFEATVQKQPDHADAWSMLGEAQAQNEEENNAIAAFLTCIQLDPYNLKALMHLGVSYTNDFEEHRALNYLKTWMLHNPDYQNAALSQQKQKVEEYMQFYSGSVKDPMVTYDNTLHQEVTKMYLQALAIRPDDPDLHTVLGVLYHISSDFDKAIEAFKTAVKLKPEDAALWNKLGATQANSTRSGEAVHAYQRALQLRPGFVRALANMAIAYANQGRHDEAVQTYLQTLAHNPEANHVWSYLRISLSHLQRHDLIEISHKKNVELFRPFFQF